VHLGAGSAGRARLGDVAGSGAKPLYGLYSRHAGEVMQSRNPLIADFADLMADAFSAAQAAGDEARGAARAQAARIAAELDLVSRDEHDALKAELDAARDRIDALEQRIAALEPAKTKPASGARRPSSKKSSG